jgi:prepilin-type N-terminal cleavage/methylation domain-containing protein
MFVKTKKFLNDFRYKDKGFTLIELLVVIAILGCLAGVAIPHLVEFADRGRPETAATELYNIQHAVWAMFTDSDTCTLTPVTDVTDMDNVVTTDTTPLVLSDYLTGLESDGTLRTIFTYNFSANGTVTQNVP